MVDMVRTAEPSRLVLAAARPASGAPTARSALPRTRSVLLQVIGSAVVALILVAVAGSIVSRHTAESESVHEVAQLTDVLAQNVIQPALSDAMATSIQAAQHLDTLVHTQVLSSSLIRVKLWTPAGEIIYSDEPRLVGKHFGLDSGARQALSAPATRASISDVNEPENLYERGYGKLLSVYRPVWTPSGKPLLLETYFRYTIVSERSAQLWRGFSGIMISSLLAFVALLTPLVWTLLSRARRAAGQREVMLQHSVEASSDERRRIAATLHDGVVQELVAASFAVAGSEQTARARGESDLARGLQSAGDAIRNSIGEMRSLLVDIYPAGLRAAGLVPALRELTSTQREPQITSSLDAAAADALSPEQQEAFYRVAQECLRNAGRHAHATLIRLTLQELDGVIVLRVADNGVGFDPTEARAEGHFGLELMTDAAHGIGAELTVVSAPAAGTVWRLEARP